MAGHSPTMPPMRPLYKRKAFDGGAARDRH
jgi:hypothetical protein